MNCREWTNEEKRRVVQIDAEERQIGRNFMKIIKERWDCEFPDKKKTSQNLVDSRKKGGEKENKLLLMPLKRKRKLNGILK